jgi:hypothetical protein
VFEYLILHHSRPTKAEEEKGKKPTTTELVAPKRVIATSPDKAMLLAARDIPPDYVDRVDEVELCVRPF